MIDKLNLASIERHNSSNSPAAQRDQITFIRQRFMAPPLDDEGKHRI